MTDRVVLAPAGYALDPSVGSDPERPWRFIRDLGARGIRVVVVARTVARAPDLGPGVTLRLLPGSANLPASPAARLVDRVRLYRYARAVARQEVRRGGVLAVHHFGPCSRRSPSLISNLPVPFVYGPMPGTPRHQEGPAKEELVIWLQVPGASRRQALFGRAFAALASPLAHSLWRRTITRADAVTVDAKANIPPERPDSVVIPAGIDTATFSPDSQAAIPGRIVAVGAMLWRKGFDVLIRALALAKTEAPNVHAVLAGDGPAKHAFEMLAAELGVASSVSFVGRVAREDLPGLYRSAIAAAHPARFESFPLAPLEAMACGLPVLTSDIDALPEMVGEAGFVHSLGDTQELARQLVAVVRDEALRNGLASAARQRALSLYSSEVVCGRYLDLYQRLGARRTGVTQDGRLIPNGPSQGMVRGG